MTVCELRVGRGETDRERRIRAGRLGARHRRRRSEHDGADFGQLRLDVDWTGLAPGTRYHGGVSYRKSAGAATSDNLLDFTVVGIDTR